MPSTSPDLNSVNGGSLRIDILIPVRGIGQVPVRGGGDAEDVRTGFQNSTAVHIKAAELLHAGVIFCEAAFLIFKTARANQVSNSLRMELPRNVN